MMALSDLEPLFYWRCVICMPLRGANANCYSITRLVKNGSVISATDGSLSSEVATVINSFLQFQQCQRFWNSCALTRSCHSRWTDSEPHRGHFSACVMEADAMWNLTRFSCAACYSWRSCK